MHTEEAELFTRKQTGPEKGIQINRASTNLFPSLTLNSLLNKGKADCSISCSRNSCYFITVKMQTKLSSERILRCSGVLLPSLWPWLLPLSAQAQLGGIFAVQMPQVFPTISCCPIHTRDLVFYIRAPISGWFSNRLGSGESLQLKCRSWLCQIGR